MTMTLWYGDGDNDAVSLGHTLKTYEVFARLADILGDDPAYQELQSVPGFSEQTVTPWWLQQAATQAEKAMAEHGREMDEELTATLAFLVKQVKSIRIE